MAASMSLAGWAYCPVGSQFKVLVEGLCGAVGGNHFVTLGGGLSHQSNAFPVVRRRLRRIGLDGFVKRCYGFIRLVRVGEYGPFVEVVSGCVSRLGGSGGIVFLDIAFSVWPDFA